MAIESSLIYPFNMVIFHSFFVCLPGRVTGEHGGFYQALQSLCILPKVTLFVNLWKDEWEVCQWKYGKFTSEHVGFDQWTCGI